MRVKRLLSSALSLLLVGIVVPGFAFESQAAPASGLHAADWRTAQDLIEDITVGWNLGNTLDAHPDGFTVGNHSRETWTVEEQETLWGNPVTTKAMIRAIRDSGFNAIRIPVTWYPMLDSDFQVRADWMDRVQRVVDYAYNDGMIVILNTHHDESLINLGRATGVTTSNSQRFVTRIWSQISDRFATYNHRLIFECFSEPRTMGSPYEWTGGTATERANLNKLNQLCVDTIRANGHGYNSTRFLMVPTYAAAVNEVALRGWKMPTDPAGPNRLIVSLHAYVPWRFAADASASRANCPEGCRRWSASGTGSQNGVGEIISALNLARNRFPNYPIILGEMAALNRGNNASRVAWAQYYNKLATSLGMRVFWWDNGQFAVQQVNGPDNFAIFDRRTLSWPFPTLVRALLNSVKPTTNPAWGTM